ncbi:hypothetical protein D3C78_1299940 [compost metagenome]
MFWCFLQKLYAIAAYTQLKEVIEIFGTRLFDGIINRIAAAFIDPDRMGHSNPILQGCTLILAWSAAVRVISAFAEEGAVYTMLCMEHRQMLVNDDLHL